MKLILGKHLKKFHDHFVFNIISNMAFNSHCAHLRSCVGLKVGAWVFVDLIIPHFCLLDDVFPSVLRIMLGLPHPLILEVT
jgi:hypothetical protein